MQAVHPVVTHLLDEFGEGVGVGAEGVVSPPRDLAGSAVLMPGPT